MLCHIGNADKTLEYFDMLSNITLEEKGTKTVLIRGMGNEKARMTLMLSVLGDGCKLPLYAIMWR
jgi:hypothetical protein